MSGPGSNPSEQEFRAEVRQFVAAHPPRVVRRCPLGSMHTRAEREQWIRILNRQGWLVPHWNADWGGRDWSALRRYVLQEELCAAWLPETDRIATELVGPVLQRFGTHAQQRRYLPAILSASEFWCQGFSEAEAGSDLSMIRTSARRDGAHYVVNGRKMWITQAHVADMMFALVRIIRNGELQSGLSFMLIDMHAPGVQTRPIVTLDGGHHINEVSFADVRVPLDALVGEEGRGWGYARTILDHERVAASGIPYTRRDFRLLLSLTTARDRDRPAGFDAVFRAKLAEFEGELCALEGLNVRVLSSGDQSPAAQGLLCVLKFRGALAYQRVSELLLEAMGPRSLCAGGATTAGDGSTPPGADAIAATYLFRRSATIAAGTTELQKNMIAALALELHAG